LRLSSSNLSSAKTLRGFLGHRQFGARICLRWRTSEPIRGDGFQTPSRWTGESFPWCSALAGAERGGCQACNDDACGSRTVSMTRTPQPVSTIGAFGIFAILTFVYAEVLPPPLYLLVPAGYWYFVHSCEGRRCRELTGGLVGGGEFAAGLVLGMLGVTAPVLSVALLGYRGHLLIGGAGLGALSSGLLAAFAEEPLFRGILLRYTELRLGSARALVILAGTHWPVHSLC